MGSARAVATTSETTFALHTRHGDVSFVPGVNLGATLPGHYPGEVAIEATDYRRWFAQMGAMGIRAVRIYTIHRPDFYTELLAYNTLHPDAPLYLMQGVYPPDESYVTTQNVFDPAPTKAFDAELRDAVAAVTGRLSRDPVRGHADGHWTADVSAYVMGWIIGAEMDPDAVLASDARNARQPSFKGTYFGSTVQASPTERWLAARLDGVAGELTKIGTLAPLAFVNWPTTDPLRHPSEPIPAEDLVGIDANNVAPTSAWRGGYFASYHAYPYYPDFQRHQPDYQSAVYAGRKDPYAGYLRDLKAHHGTMPMIVSEFGVPSSVGAAHFGPLGRDQGNHSEQESMAIDAELLKEIKDLGLSGGFLFEWTDEWFKYTWNTIDDELPGDRRQLWLNPLTNEEHFGLVATDPGAQPVVTVDGNGGEWLANGSQVIEESRGPLREVRAAKDEGYLYLRLVLDDPSAWQREAVTIGIDVVPGGNGGLPELPHADPGADYAVVLGPGRLGSSLVSSRDDPFWVTYGLGRHYLSREPPAYPPGSGVGVWHLQRQITNRPLVVPSTGQRLALESFAVGKLRFGTADPADPRFDSRVTWAAGDCVEIRLPYALIGFADPSSRQALVVRRDGAVTTSPVDRVGLEVAVGREVSPTSGYSWDPWQTVAWHERQKAGVAEFAAAVRDVSR